MDVSNPPPQALARVADYISLPSEEDLDVMLGEEVGVGVGVRQRSGEGGAGRGGGCMGLRKGWRGL